MFQCALCNIAFNKAYISLYAWNFHSEFSTDVDLINALNGAMSTLDVIDNDRDENSKLDIEIIQQQCGLNAKRAQIEDNISAALDLLTAHPNPIDGSATSHPDVNGVIAKKLFVLDKSDKLISPKIRKNPNSVFNKYT